MSDFDFLKQYIIEPGMKIDSSKKHVFYRLSDEQIKEAEDRWGRKFPKELRNFFSEIGYGFVCHSFQSRFNRLMDPEGIVDFIFGEEFYLMISGEMTMIKKICLFFSRYQKFLV